MLQLILDLQSERIDSQRATLAPTSKTATSSDNNTTTLSNNSTNSSKSKKSTNIKSSILPGLITSGESKQTKPDDDFLDMLAKVQVSIIKCT